MFTDKNILITFDIDATLLKVPRTNNCHSHSIQKAMFNIFGIDENISDYVGYKFHGMSDKTIINSIVEKSNKTCKCNDELVQEMIKKSEEHFVKDFNHEVEVLNGVERLLKDLSSFTNVDLSICSGNLPKIGEEKLKAAGLWDYFKNSCCGWGLVENRKDILQNALYDTMNKRHKKYDVLIHVGDAFQDYQCAIDMDEAEKEMKIFPIVVLTGACRDFPENAIVLNNLDEGHDNFINIITKV